jgi:hypothetical protein
MRRFRLALPLLLSPVALVLALWGCVAGTEGIQGVYTFYDRTPPSEHAFPWDGDQVLDAPLAVGATMTIGVTYSGFAVHPEKVQMDPPGIVTVDALQDGAFVVTGVSAGQVLLTVTGATRWDQVRLDVKAPTAARVEARPWDWYPLPAAYFDGGLAVLQGATSHLFGRALAGGGSLTGAGPHAFRAAGDQGHVAGTPRAGSNFLDLTGVSPGTERFAWGPSDEVEVACVTEADIASVRPLEAWHTQSGASYVCEVGETLFVMLVPYDGAGRLVSGTTSGDGPSVSLPETAAGILSDTTPAQPSADLKAVLQNRTVFLKCEGVGTAEATLYWRNFPAVAVTVAVKAKTR